MIYSEKDRNLKQSLQLIRMGIVDKIKKMQEEGKSEEEIANNLAKSKVSKEEISDALAQARIKHVVSQENEEMQQSMMERAQEDANTQLSSQEAPYPSDQTQTDAEYA
ncbi:MAG: hypothetical protein PHD31_02835, partial [Candidatus Pacebacteria bacterium]|nr:hypothetical protein [Candidatus Paceibacterota bacterium]